MFLDFRKWVKSIQTAGYIGARTVCNISFIFVVSRNDKLQKNRG